MEDIFGSIGGGGVKTIVGVIAAASAASSDSSYLTENYHYSESSTARLLTGSFTYRSTLYSVAGGKGGGGREGEELVFLNSLKALREFRDFGLPPCIFHMESPTVVFSSSDIMQENTLLQNDLQKIYRVSCCYPN